MTNLTSAAVSLLKDLVAFDTVSRTSNLKLIAYVEQYLQGFGIPSQRVLNADGTQANLIARIGPDKPGGIILSGHTDVVPTVGQSWDTPPYTLTESLGRLYGRGSTDMKGFLACALAFAPEFARARLAAPIYFAFSYDEEVGCLGAPSLVDHIVATSPLPKLAIIGEPTNMQVVTSHKGVYSYETIVTGKEAHSSQVERGINAVQIAAKLVAFLADMATELAAMGKRDPRFDPGYTTVHVGVIEGGTARNIIPKTCRFLWEIRPLPGYDAEPLLRRFENYIAELTKASPGAEINTTMLSRMLGMQLKPVQDEEQFMLALAQANATYAVAFGTEAGVFQERGIPAVVCGPGDISQAHRPNEYIDITQIEKCLAFLDRLKQQLSAD